MTENTYSNILVCFGDADRDIITKQIRMLKERFHSSVVLIITSDEDIKSLDAHSEVFDETLALDANSSLMEAVIEYCKEKHLPENETTLIAEISDSEQLQNTQMQVKSPGAMTESYKKALEMLGSMLKPRM
ncbi:hypothetical protein [Butyrivibrio sp. AC2005]|uniref:hypothetical protein n=1 Tax=Butyrivibrio sp. AC2005 TaxID=1280672 RepID=UPI00041BADAF|nr:hypothetical protein [Butyrivibrio sp. AC2005]